MASLTAAVEAIQAVIDDVDGVEHVPEAPPENLTQFQFPAVVVYAASGHWRLGTANDGTSHATRWGMHTIHADLHIQRGDLALDVAAAMAFSDSIPNALIAGFVLSKFSGTVVSLGDANRAGTPPLRYELIELNWGGLETVGWRFALDVSVEELIDA